MPPDQLINDMPCHRLEIKGAAFPGQLAMKNHLQQQIAQLFRHLLVISGLNGVRTSS